MHPSLHCASCAIVLVAMAVSVPAKTLYVSVSGDNSFNGESESTPFKTVGYALTKVVSGDKIMLKRGDVFREGGLSLGSGREMGAYGTGNRPVMCGSQRIVGWTPWTGRAGVYSATMSTPIENLYVNTMLMRIARYPNSGFFRTTANDATSHIVSCSGLSANPQNAAGYWNGCRMRWRHWNWYFDTRIIQSYAASGTMTLAGAPVQNDGNGKTDWGFYLDGKLSELDTAGEWFYDSAASRVYLYPPPGVAPETALIEGTVLDAGMSLSTAIVRDVEFRQYRKTGVSIDWQCILSQCTFSGIGGDSGGVAVNHTWNASGSKIVNCTFSHNQNVAISIVKNPAATTETLIESDTIVAQGIMPGYGGKGSWHAAGVVVYAGNHVRIRNCRFDSIGYAAILLGSAQNTAEYNFINHAMATLVDGAAIYTNCDSSLIRNNIILNTIGSWEGSPFHLNGGNGIWPEFLSHFKGQKIIDNTCAYGHHGNGIFFPNNFSSTVRGNVCYDNVNGMHLEGGFYTNDNLPLQDSIVGNVFYATAVDQKAFSYRPEYTYGTISSNWYCNPVGADVISQYDAPPGNVWNANARTLLWWKTNWTQADQKARGDIITRSATSPPTDLRGTSRLVYNDDTLTRSIALDTGVYLTLDSQTVSGSIKLAPFTSKVLVHTGQNTATVKSNVLGAQGGTVRLFQRKNALSFLLADAQSVRISIFDCKGVCRAIIVHKKSESRTCTIHSFLSMGMYCAQISTDRGGASQSQRIFFSVMH